MINAGQLDTPITIEQNVTITRNDRGEKDAPDWQDFHKTFAKRMKFGGIEQIEADKVTATRKVKYMIRRKFEPKIQENMRLHEDVDDTEIYNITNIQYLDRFVMILTAEKKL